MIHLNYKSLKTKKNVESIVSKLKNKQLQKDFINTMSKIDIKIATEPIKITDRYCYKIWVLRKGTKKKALIIRYCSKKINFNKNTDLNKYGLSFSDILILIRLNADVPNDFEEYCERISVDPSDKSCRDYYIILLKKAERLKKLLSMEEISSLPMSYDYKNYSEDLGFCDICDNDGNVIEVVEMNDQENPKVLEILGYEIISLNDRNEYDKLIDLENILAYYRKIIESSGCYIEINEFNIEVSICECNLEKENIEKYVKEFIDIYNQKADEYYDHLKFLIKKYYIKPSGNISKKVAFIFRNENNEEQMNHNNYKPIIAILDYRYF